MPILKKGKKPTEKKVASKKKAEKKIEPFSVKGKNGVKFYLHESKMYFFAKTIGKNAIAKKPDDKKVKKNKSGFPFLVRV